MLICSILCCWLGTRIGHILLGSDSTWSCYTSSPWYPRKSWWKGVASVGDGRGGASVRNPCSLFLLCRTGAFPRVLGCHTPEAAWKVFVGASLPICFQLVYSVLPGALVNGVYGASLFFVHPFPCDCCSRHLGRTCACLALGVASQPVFPYNVQEQEFFSLPPDTGGAK